MADLKNQRAQHRRRAGGGAGGAANRWLVLAIVLTAVFMQLLDVTITTVALSGRHRPPASRHPMSKGRHPGLLL